jgi:hypothetical protein
MFHKTFVTGISPCRILSESIAPAALAYPFGPRPIRLYAYYCSSEVVGYRVDVKFNA